MNPLNINFTEHSDNIINALSEVYGYEYKDIITQKFNNVNHIYYNNLDGIISYYNFLLFCKKQELTLKFLNQIGIDTNKYGVISYAEPFNKDLKKLVSKYLDNLSFTNNFIPQKGNINPFDKTINDMSNPKIINKQLKFINLFKNNNIKTITTDTLDKYKTTEDYLIVLNKIDEYFHIYNNLLNEYSLYTNTLKDFETYINNERNRYSDMVMSKELELYNIIKAYLPAGIKNILNNNCTDDQSKIAMISSNNMMFQKLYLEYFSKEDEEKLSNPNVEESEKSLIYVYRLSFLNSLGIKVNPWSEVNNYYKIINQEDVKPLIPTDDFIKIFQIIKQMMYDDVKRNLIISSETYIDNMNKYTDNSLIQENIYKFIENKSICLIKNHDHNYLPTPILFYTLKSGTEGKSDYVYLHEIIHAIESNLNQDMDYMSGYDCLNRNNCFNLYRTEKRKYEIINEVFADIFAIETRNILHNNGIYIANSKENTVYNVNNFNTSNLLKEIVKPLIIRYRSEIIKTRLFSDIDELFNSIGKENFEELNNSINKIDYFITQGLENKLKSNDYSNPLVIAYKHELEKINQIYLNIENYVHDISINKKHF